VLILRFYYAAFCGFYDLAERLLIKHPEQVNLAGGFVLAPLPAALSKRHFRVADLLSKHDADVDVRDQNAWTPLHGTTTKPESVDITRWLLEHGANASAQSHFSQTPLHHATHNADLETVRVLLEYKSDVGLRDTSDGHTPLHEILRHVGSSTERNVLETVWLLLEYGADPNTRRTDGLTPLHRASSYGSTVATRLLLRYGLGYGANEKDEEGRTPFQVASLCGHNKIMKMLSEHPVVPEDFVYCSDV
jgi:ankyrin repeat protein